MLQDIIVALLLAFHRRSAVIAMDLCLFSTRGIHVPAGIDRARLESFDRPIKVEPEDYPDKRGPLIHDFRHYLGILKAVHSGADLNASAEAAGGNLPGGAKGSLGYVLSHQGDQIILPLIENAVAARAEIVPAMSGNRYKSHPSVRLAHSISSKKALQGAAMCPAQQSQPTMVPLNQNASARAQLSRSFQLLLTESSPRQAPKFWPLSQSCLYRRELLYLDLALEAVVRSAAERGSKAAGAQASPLVRPLLENLVLSTGDNEELCYCLKAWQDLPTSVQAGNYPSKQDALKVRCPSPRASAEIIQRCLHPENVVLPAGDGRS